MKELKIKILGNGGCLNEGLPYNTFIINKDFLFESPPDVMLSIKKYNIDLSNLKYLFISHLHGDHTFGFPFLVINLWFLLNSRQDYSLKVYGPENTADTLRHLVEVAFSKEHPCYIWMIKNVVFMEIDHTTKMTYSDLECSFFELEHIQYTYGFKIKNSRSKIFTYIADTKWGDSVVNELKEMPQCILADMNGLNPTVHMSKEDFEEKGHHLTNGQTIFYGTHLSNEFKDSENIKCAKAGEEIVVQVGKGLG